MKRFRFPLSRVMDWRATQARVEEGKLEAMYAELRGIDSRERMLIEERAASERAVLTGSGATGVELAALDQFRRFTLLEHTRLEKIRADCSRRIAAQIEVVSAKRRDVRLLDRLKQRRLADWTQEASRETDRQAEEAYLAKWPRTV